MEKLAQLLQHPPSPLEPVHDELFAAKGLRLFVKRDDLLHPQVSGNKWRKLQHNLLGANRLGHSKLITFGGTFSNHIAAVAAAGLDFGFSTLGVISGEADEARQNPTLRFAKACGMALHFTSRTAFRSNSPNDLLKILGISTEGATILPQGGANCLALPGCRAIVAEAEAQLGHLPDYFVTACGTGTTLAGIASGISGQGCKALGVPVLKGGFMQKEVENLLAACGETPSTNWQIVDGFHHGGYAKWTPELVAFINDFKRRKGIPLDPIYTGKAFYAASQLAKEGYFPAGSSIVLVHTGGLQGIAGFNERFGGGVIEA